LTGVRVSLSNSTVKSSGAKQVAFSTSGNETLKENVINVFGTKQFQSIRPLSQHFPSEEVLAEFSLRDFDESHIDFKIDGWISSVEHGKGRSSADRQFLFINRWLL
jgi:DNA mismatch repair protein PMS2